MPLPKGTPEEVLKAAAGGDIAPPDITGTAAQLFPKTKHVHVPDYPGAREDHHRVFYLPGHEMRVVVSIEQKSLDDAESYIVLHAECWEVDERGEATGLRAPTTTHSIPHRHLDGSSEAAQILDDAVDLITAIAVERTAKRKKALNSVVEHPRIKELPPEIRLKPPKLPRSSTDPTL